MFSWHSQTKPQVTDMTILVASLIAPPILDDPRRWGSWLNNHGAILNSVPGTEIKYYCSVELDGRGLEPYRKCGWVELIEQLGITYETWTYDSGRKNIHTNNRLKHICLARNMVVQHAIADSDVTHIMCVDSDVTPPHDIIPNLLALNYPLVSAHIPTYCFIAGNILFNPRDPEQEYPKAWRVQPTPQSSAGAWLIDRSVFTALRWRTDPDKHLSDDPSYLYDARHVLGLDPPILQRSDTIAHHWPATIGPIETRVADPTIVPLSK